MTVTDAPVPQAEQQVLVPGLVDSSADRGTFPFANLLPDAIRLRREVSHAKRRALMMVLGVLGLLALLVLVTMVQQNSANAARDSAQAQLDEALVQKQRYSYVPAVYLAVSSAREELAAAMGQEVQVSRLMSSLASLQPSGVSLQTWNVTVGAGEADGALPDNQEVLPGVGTAVFTGEAKSMEDIATWLERVRISDDYSSPVLNQVGTTTDGIFSFDAGADLTEQALSGRFVEAEK